MLLQLFNIKKDRFGLDINQIVEIIPLVNMKKIPLSPSYISGLINYRGVIVPVVSLSMVFANEPTKELLSTRIIILNYRSFDNEDHLLGLLVEQVTEIFSCKESDLQPTGVDLESSRFLGEVINHEDGMIQNIKIKDLLPIDVQKILFNQSA